MKEPPTFGQIFIKEIPDSKITNDFYHNTLDWSKANLLAFVKADKVRIVNPSDSDTPPRDLLKICRYKATAIKFSPDSPNIMAVGGSKPFALLFDLEKTAQTNEFYGHGG